MSHPQDFQRALYLLGRHQITRVLRGYLDEEGFLELHAPLWVKGTCPDVGTESQALTDGYLTTSTEYAIKRLMAEGFTKVYTLTQNFRPGDVSPRHNPEFTMLEWGRTGAGLRSIEEDCEAMVRGAWVALGSPALSWQGLPVELGGAWEHRTVAQVVGGICGEEPEDFDLQTLNRVSQGVEVPNGFRTDAHALISWIMAEAEKGLGSPVPVWVTDWPAWMTASAPSKAGAQEIAQRSELFIAGLEISDGFPFLTDPVRQRQLFERDLERRSKVGRSVVPDWRYVDMLSGLPEGAGMALGVDRLVMILTGASTIEEVIAFPWHQR